MTIGSITDLENGMDFAAWALETGLWNGREITSAEVNDFTEELIANITAKFFLQDSESLDFQKMAAQLAYIGSWETDREECKEELSALTLHNGIAIPAGFCKSTKKFWKKHKVEIIVGIVVVAVVVAVAVGVLCGAAAAGAAAAEAANKKKDPPKQTPPKQTEIDPSEPVNTLNNDFSEAFSWPQTELSMDEEGVVLNGERLSIDNALNTQAVAQAIQSYGDIPLWRAYESFLIRDPAEFGTELAGSPLYSGNYLSEQKVVSPNNMKNICENFSGNYAASIIHGSLANRSDVPPPFREIPLIGNDKQGTVHFHCGINNNELTVTEGGTRLWETLDQNFAVHPHLIHSDSLIHGLTMVHLEKWDNPQITRENLRPMMAINPDIELALLPREILQNSLIQRSIEYEVSMLTKIADNIIERGNPKLKQAHVAFSNGGHIFKEALQRLTPEQQQTVIVITAGTTSIIDDHLACKVYNLIGSEDWPSIACNGGKREIGNAKEFTSVEIVLQTETKSVIRGHYFLQPEYQDKIKNIFKINIAEEYEIY